MIFFVPNKEFTYDTYKNLKLEYEYIKPTLDLCNSSYSYYYNNNQDMIKDKHGKTKKPSGKIYIIPNNLFNINSLNKDDFFSFENNIPYSKLI